MNSKKIIFLLAVTSVSVLSSISCRKTISTGEMDAELKEIDRLLHVRSGLYSQPDEEKQAHQKIKNLLHEIKRAAHDEETWRLAKSWNSYIASHFKEAGRARVLEKFKTDFEEIDMLLTGTCYCE